MFIKSKLGAAVLITVAERTRNPRSVEYDPAKQSRTLIPVENIECIMETELKFAGPEDVEMGATVFMKNGGKLVGLVDFSDLLSEE